MVELEKEGKAEKCRVAGCRGRGTEEEEGGKERGRGGGMKQLASLLVNSAIVSVSYLPIT